MYKTLIRPVLFSLDPEIAHGLAVHMGKVARVPVLREIVKTAFDADKNNTQVSCFGITFPNPIWMASGLDKDGHAIDFFSALGFGSLELGGVVPRPQQGNEKPRLKRFPEQGALINRMGFPSQGCQQVARNIEAARIRLKDTVKLGMNLAKATATPVENAADDYLESFRTLYDLVDFFTVNISCPNVAAYQVLQEKKNLSKILDALQKHNPKSKPLVVKLSSDLTLEATDEAIETAIEYGVRGIIATNTTTRRDIFEAGNGMAGGLSGLPLWPIAIDRVRYIAERFGSRVDIVGVGGVRTPNHVQQMLGVGAKAIQLYTGLVYEGPGLVSRLKQS